MLIYFCVLDAIKKDGDMDDSCEDKSIMVSYIMLLINN